MLFFFTGRAGFDFFAGGAFRFGAAFFGGAFFAGFFAADFFLGLAIKFVVRTGLRTLPEKGRLN